ncbi:MAG: MATE family efflux transporter [Ruminococcaceae bacterium]|nr:MATE family efflux transporter [Oscillospiraceae bacterium]
MTETPVWRLIITLGIPTTVSMLITNIYNMADTYFVSTLSNAAGGATSIVFSVMAILQAFGFMFGHGAGSHVSRLLGARDSERAGRFTSTSLLLSSLCGTVIMVFGLIFLEPLMLFLGSNEEILPHAKDYAIYIFIAAPAMTASCVFNNVLRYEGKATFAMIGLTSGGILNILFDYIFIMHLGMGTAGAGLATAISQYISLIILAVPFFIGKTQSKIAFGRGFMSWRIVWDIVTTGLPSLIRQGLSSISTGMLNVQAKAFGTAAISAMGYVSKTVQFIFCVGLGIGQGFQPVSAFNYGAKKYSRVKKGSYFTMAFGLLLIGSLAAVCYGIAPSIISIFNSEGDPEVTRIGVEALRINCMVLWVLPFTVVGNMMFQSIGKRIPAILLSALQNGIAFMPMIYLLPYICERLYQNGLLGLEMAQPAAYVLTALVTLPCTVIFLSKLPCDEDAIKQ